MFCIWKKIYVITVRDYVHARYPHINIHCFENSVRSIPDNLDILIDYMLESEHVFQTSTGSFVNHYQSSTWIPSDSMLP